MKAIILLISFLTLNVQADTGYDILGVILCKAPQLCTQSELTYADQEIVNRFTSTVPKPYRDDLCKRVDIELSSTTNLQDQLNEMINDGLQTCLEGKL